jgi:hypothetical protein
MSHFTVLVVGENIEEQLAPFQENNMDDCPKEYLEFSDEEEESKKEYEEETIEMYRKISDGTLYYTWDARFRKETEPHYHKFSEELTEGYEKVNVSYKEKYATFEEFMEDYKGFNERDAETGKYGYWRNPNAKWDWYQIGGRWTGMFKLKKGTMEYATGSAGLMTEPAEEGYADQCKKKDIDFDGMRQDAENRAIKEYDMVAKFFGGTIPKLRYRWKDMIDENGKFTGMDIDDKRTMYHAQEPLMELKNRREEIDKLPKEERSFMIWLDLENFQCTKEEYIQDARDSSIVTFALVKDGKWYERGEMGWWACVSNENDNWDKEYSKLLDEISDDTLLTVVDCHI